MSDKPGAEPLCVIFRIKRDMGKVEWNKERKQQEYVKKYEIEPMMELSDESQVRQQDLR